MLNKYLFESIRDLNVILKYYKSICQKVFLSCSTLNHDFFFKFVPLHPVLQTFKHAYLENLLYSYLDKICCNLV